MRTIDFKTVSPLYEMERDGIKPFTTRNMSIRQANTRALSQWQKDYNWAIRITNPATQESFKRKLLDIQYILRAPEFVYLIYPCWVILHLGAKLEEKGT